MMERLPKGAIKTTFFWWTMYLQVQVGYLFFPQGPFQHTI